MPPTLDPAPKDSVQQWAKRLLPLLSPISQQRLGQLIDLIADDGRIPYAQAYAALFPDSLGDPAAKTRADKTFNGFRTNLAAIADEHGMLFQLRVDQRKKAAPTERRLWFVTADDSEARIVAYNQAKLHGLPEQLVDQPFAERSEHPRRRYLLLYAQNEQKKALELHQLLADQLLSLDRAWAADDWQQPAPGTVHEQEQARMLEQASAVLALLSPALIAELKSSAQPFQSRRPIVPLALRRVTKEQLRNTAFSGLEVFRDQGQSCWDQIRGATRAQWISDAAQHLIQRLERPERADTRLHRLMQQPQWRAQDCDPQHFVDPPMDAPEPASHRRQAAADPPEPKTALPFLLDWLRDPAGDCFCAIFGELGMGKTMLCQRLTVELLRLRAKDQGAAAALPLPLYLDLRAIHDMDWDWEQGAPSLDAMLRWLIHAGYQPLEDQPPPEPAQISRLAQRQGGLVIFDGLDEVMNRLTPEQCRRFLRALWEILPPRLWKPPRPAPRNWQRAKGVGRLIMTCRSHFFPHLKAQLSALDGEQREQVAATDYLWLTLLPFGPAQVEQYFHQVFADDPAQAQRLIAMLDEVHDLRDLGSRPYNLRLIQHQVDSLEAQRRAGRSVDIADLYEGLVDDWLHRDDPKHRLEREHKLILMERLAHRLWASAERDLNHAQLEDWLLDQILAEPRWRNMSYFAYRTQPGRLAILHEDLRNASFLVREGEDRFRFAHSSIMEFFLARSLHRALCAAGANEQPQQTSADRFQAWSIPRPSPETLSFLGGLIQRRDTALCLRGLDRLRADYRPHISELALAYCLHAHRHRLPGAHLRGFRLAGIALRDQHWQGRPGDWFDCRDLDLTGADLANGRFEDCDFGGSRLDRADLSRALFDRCRLCDASAENADLTGTSIHDCDATGLRACERTA